MHRWGVGSSNRGQTFLGFYFNTEPNVKLNMKMVQRKLKCRVWSLRHLKWNGFKTGELVKVYAAMVRSVAEYCSAVFHSLSQLPV